MRAPNPSVSVPKITPLFCIWCAQLLWINKTKNKKWIFQKIQDDYLPHEFVCLFACDKGGECCKSHLTISNPSQKNLSCPPEPLMIIDCKCSRFVYMLFQVSSRLIPRPFRFTKTFFTDLQKTSPPSREPWPAKTNPS